jgi:Zn-dependent M16 (insulinase) family peptidase
MSSTPNAHSSFDFVRTTQVETLKLEVQEFRHRETGAPHIHLAADDNQNAFMVAFRTVPEDSTGVAHILEHTALCGSRKYPVRDPFFMMTRRSLNTFMNAFTASDWTAYPFASCNRKDFYNLLGVYLDAAFFPTLDRLDFLQEGWRVEFAEADDPNSELVYKGVVFNEMKGAMSSPVSTLWQILSEHLFPSVTYHHNSGGDPERIPDLTHEQLKAFHAGHYHPSNAIFLTYGDIAADEHQAMFQEQALKAFQRDEQRIRVGEEQRYDQPRSVEASYALDGEEETAAKTHIVTGWLLGRNTRTEDVLTAHLLSGVLLDNSASPLRHALETTDLGEAPSPLCGFQDSTYEMVFACGLEGSEPEHSEAVERLILDTLTRVAEEGVPQEMVESVLHQIELSQREVSGDGFPYGLQMMLHVLTPAVHDSDPAEALNIDPILEKLRERIQDPAYIKGLVREMLIDNPHRVRLTMAPDTGLSAQRAEREKARLAEILANMDDAEKQRVVETAAALKARQEQQDDPGCLPNVTREDIPADMNIPEGQTSELAQLPLSFYGRGTNGLVYQQLIVDLPELDADEANLLTLYADLLTEVGSGGRDYMQTQALQAAVTGGIGARVAMRGAVDDVTRQRSLFILSGKSLVRNQPALSQLMRETFDSARFDEDARIRELVAQERLSREQSVTGRGHVLAMTAAAAAISPTASIDHRWGGLAAIQTLKALDDALQDDAELAQLRQRFATLEQRLLAAPKQILLVGEAEHQGDYQAALESAWSGLAGSDGGVFQPAALQGPVRQAWTTSTQVNFCATAYATVPAAHADAPALVVLASFLRNNFLHRAIREQGGAYGGGASFDSDTGAFRFYSYRDPRLAETLADYRNAIDWMISSSHDPRLLEEAILGIVSDIDKPGSPAGEAKKAFHNTLHGRTPEVRRRFRQRILDVSLEDLRRVAETYLAGEPDGIAVITNPELAKQAELGLEIVSL